MAELASALSRLRGRIYTYRSYAHLLPADRGARWTGGRAGAELRHLHAADGAAHDDPGLRHAARGEGEPRGHEGLRELHELGRDSGAEPADAGDHATAQDRGGDADAALHDPRSRGAAGRWRPRADARGLLAHVRVGLARR